MTIQKVGFDFAALAKKQGKKFTSVPLKDKSTANVLWNKNSFDCFITKKGKLNGGCGASGPADYLVKEFAQLIDKLGKNIEPGVDLVKKFGKLYK